MDLSNTPIFDSLPPAERAALLEVAQRQPIAAGEVLFYEGDPADTLYLLEAGGCALTWGDEPRGEALPGALIDPVAALGGLPHGVKATATGDGAVLRWPVKTLWESAAFSAEARRYLATTLRGAQTRLDTLDAPINYRDAGASLLPGPYLFDNVTMVFAFCEADLDAIRKTLPAGLSLLRAPLLRRGVLLLALTDFPRAYPEHNPDARMAPYTETTCFVPVRRRTACGLFVPYIYPSAWEPILLGREIYGFPKRLGQTTLTSKTASLTVDGNEHFHLCWEQAEPSSEPALVGALVGLLGIEKHVGALAFQAGEVVRKAMRLPAHRRVDVYNHKRILAAGATHDAPTYAVDCLTRATFGVLRWYQIAKARDPVLAVSGGPLADANLTLRAAYRTQLDMRLSAGRVVRDYNAPPPPPSPEDGAVEA